ncbi:endonuclease/exonuclease/phosphatase family protein [Marinactinospora rubrisoli]|uniref:Endonuclease/exonuclease/phosphatase family protein n=1 Tax=Marinactinospora rubrisoli TaxID=2715399 RepID=A0ABW2KME5_9ACTN
MATSRTEPGPAASRPRRTAARCLAGLALAAPTAVLGCRLAGVDGVTPLPQLLAFLPYLLVPAAAALALALLASWRAGLAWAVAVLFGLGAVLPSYDRAAPPPTAAPVATVRVLTANLKLGAATDALAGTLRREHPDLVFVQECDPACGRLLSTEEMTARYPHRIVTAVPGAEGSAILSRHPLRPAGEVPATLAMPTAETVIEGVPVALQLAHPLPPIPGMVDSWRRELAALHSAATALDGPAIMAGDFNATRDHAAFRDILDTGLRDATTTIGLGHTPSWPAGTPLAGAQIDHILIRGPFRPASGEFVDLPGSDHRALLVEMELFAQG